MVIVDSSIWIEASRRTGSLEVKVAIEGLLAENEAGLCSPVMLEVLGGARREERKMLNADFSCLPYVRVTEADYIAAVRNSWKLRDAGITAPANDVLIATLALRMECRVYAQDKHFDAMAPILGLTLYEAGYGGSFRQEEVKEWISKCRIVSTFGNKKMVGGSAGSKMEQCSAGRAVEHQNQAARSTQNSPPDASWKGEAGP